MPPRAQAANEISTIERTARDVIPAWLVGGIVTGQPTTK
jgi:hypothetical protein